MKLDKLDKILWTGFFIVIVVFLSLATLGNQSGIGKVTSTGKFNGANNIEYQNVTWTAPDNSVHQFISSCTNSSYHLWENLKVHRIIGFDWQIDQLSC
jgi:hypothetical protein